MKGIFMLNRSGKIWLLILFLLCMALSPVPSEAITVPPIPSDGDFIQDYALIITPGGKYEIRKIQQTAFEVRDTPIIVVTIESMGKYEGADMSMEDFSKAWFDAWEIGKKDTSGRLINKGILLLVSNGDRKARIELGADWGQDWNKYAAEIMQKKIIPRFKQGDYSGGIAAGVTALGEMAGKGPGSPPPKKDFLTGIMEDVESAKLPTSPFSGIPLVAGTVVGVLVIIAGILAGQGLKKPVIIVGITILAVFLFTFLLILGFFILAGCMNRGSGGTSQDYTTTDYSSYDSGSYDSGGFDSGGFSGGGGATGSW